MCRTFLSLLSVAVVMWVSAAHAANQCQAPRMLIVMDKSSSMITGDVANQAKWHVAKQALSQLLSLYQSTIDFGLVLFPNPDQCGPGSLKVPVGPNNAQAILDELDSPPPLAGNWTPMAQTLEAVAQLTELQDSGYSNNILLLTDGWQWCSPYDPATRFLPVNATASLTTLGITSYVVGFGDSVDALTLNKMAHAANTMVSATCDINSEAVQSPNNCYYQANDPQQLIDALNSIAQRITAEKCDAVDNDCNGVIDDNLSRSCSTVCGQGVETCSQGIWQGCTALQPTDEICDSLDNNCDGTIDEGCSCVDGKTRSCGITKGECKEGTQTCKNGIWSACSGEMKPALEQCDGKDNNCNGTIDDGLTRPCTSTCGDGTETCVMGKYVSCTAPQPTQEICDGLDNDCDGVVDGVNARCEMGGICLDNTCQLPPSGSGCDCQIGQRETSAAGLFFGLFAVLGLLGVVIFSRRR